MVAEALPTFLTEDERLDSTFRTSVLKQSGDRQLASVPAQLRGERQPLPIHGKPPEEMDPRRRAAEARERTRRALESLRESLGHQQAAIIPYPKERRCRGAGGDARSPSGSIGEFLDDVIIYTDDGASENGDGTGGTDASPTATSQGSSARTRPSSAHMACQRTDRRPLQALPHTVHLHAFDSLSSNDSESSSAPNVPEEMRAALASLERPRPWHVG